ncbi:MAG: type II toxin-antitoxin system PemK/MazF family toxin [Oscillospiraceae bacterium]|jgi:mRNA interferase MazF|nr:type II toxin-antitoxin system PemK/MazF family toxin [Oscillospiraceae bacterium]
MQSDQTVRRGDIYYADLSPVVGSEQGGIRPVLIVQNNVGNRHSPTVIAAAITSQIGKARLPTHIELSARTYGLSRDSVVLLEQVRTIDKKRLKERMGRLDESLMVKVDTALAVSFGLNA